MIKFKSIEYQNILSVGQAPLTMDLSTFRLTALHGISGSGKSLLLDALSFVLFGKAFRDINKSELVNSINGKGLLVKIDFSIGSDEYTVTRGIKPTVFDISVNGTVLNHDSHAKDQQKFLEDQILKMNWHIFTHVVVLGAANYTPFMRLKPGDRKKMVENILGIDVFSTMNVVAKTKISDETIAYKATVEKKDTLAGQKTYLEEQQKAFQLKQESEISGLNQQLVGLATRKKGIDQEISQIEQGIELLVSGFNPKVDVAPFTATFTETFTEEFTEVFTLTFDEVFSLEKKTPEFPEVFVDNTKAFPELFVETDGSEFDTTLMVTKVASKEAESRSITQKIKEIEDRVSFFLINNSCPVCAQHIDEKFRGKSVDDLKAEIEALNATLLVYKAEIEETKEGIVALNTKKSEYVTALLSFNTRKREHEAAEKARYAADLDAFNKRKQEFFDKSQSEYVAALTAFQQRRSEFEALKKAYDDKKLAFESRRRGFEERQRAYEVALRTHEDEVRKASLKVEELKKQFELVIEEKKKTLETKRNEITTVRAEGSFILKAIEEKKLNPLLDNNAEISRLATEIQLLSAQIDTSAKRLKLLREAQAVIKDDGVKSEILKRYVPTLNRFINEYLTKMGLFVHFELDQDFNDTIRSRHRDVLSYANYSEGERQRIDLAVLLAWRNLAQAQSAVNTNLLILDEVLDSYLDQATTESILTLMKGDDFRSFNIIVISHKDGLTESFDRTIQFHKKNNFTAIAA